VIILIADDERYVRLGLKSMLGEICDALKEENRIVEARNGKEMYDLVLKYQPDIAFVDIRMPVMDGLKAIEHSKALAPNTTWVLLTGLHDFGAAVQAMKLGVSDYLSKPVGSEELTKIIEKVRLKQKDRIAERNTLFELNIINYFHVRYYSPKISADKMLAVEKGQDYLGAVLLENGYGLRDEAKKLQNVFDAEIRKILQKQIDIHFNYALFYLAKGEFCIIVKKLSSHKEDELKTIMRRAGSECYQSQKAITGIYCSADSISGLANQITRICEWYNLCALLGVGKMYSMADIEALAENDVLLSLSNKIESLCEAFSDKSEIEYRKLTSQIASELRREDIPVEYLEHAADFIYGKTGIGVEKGGVDNFMRSLEGATESMYQQAARFERTDLVSNIKAYLDANYSNEIGINSVADAFNISPTYLSRVFHQKTGKKLIDYITEIRIAKAKQIISDNPDILVKNVALFVGYSSVRHFAKVFLRIAGTYPSNYREHVGKASE
jgi:two-component system, response regulator YesN